MTTDDMTPAQQEAMLRLDITGAATAVGEKDLVLLEALPDLVRVGRQVWTGHVNYRMAMISHPAEPAPTWWAALTASGITVCVAMIGMQRRGSARREKQ